MSSIPYSRDGDDDYLEITALVRHVASECLSLSHPFTPLSRAPTTTTTTTTTTVDDGDANHCCDDTVIDGTLLGGLHVQGKSSLDVVHETTAMDSSDSPSATDDNNSQHIGQRIAQKKLPQLNLLDAMSALELGDKRMDCCEIPFPLVAETESITNAPAPSGERNGSSASDTQKQQTHAFDSSSLITYPPRIAPTCLSDGVPLCAVLPDNNNNKNNASTGGGASLSTNTLLVPTPPCPSLLPHWNNLRLSSTSLLPLLVLQLTALEAYIGTNNGGSNAAETLYCMLWFHDGVLLDMAERLGIHDTYATLHKYENEDKQREKFTNCNELNVARWFLFASSLGIVRIAEAVRLVVVSADFYEEEDFGVALHGEKAMVVDHNTNDNPGGEGQTARKSGGSTMRFCPALQGSQYCEIIWDTALSHLHSFRSSCAVANNVGEMNSTIEALETILRLQQSFYQAVHMLSNLSGNTVRAFANLAVQRSRETVKLLDKLRVNDIIIELSKIGLVGLNGQLQTRCDEPELNLLLSASFDPFVNRRYLGNAPVRKACFRSVFDVTASLSYLAAELEWGVCDPILSGNSFGRITTILEHNSLRGCGGAVPFHAHEKEASTKGGLETETPVGMNILSRSLVVMNLYFDEKLFGQYDFAFLIAQHMRQCAVPDQLIVSTDLLSLMVKPMYETLKALCLNRHRERGYTETILLPAFELLQYESAAVDEKFMIDNGLDKETTPSYATNYVILNTLRLMERHLGLGIELGLYPNWWDLHTAFWYRDFLLSALINVKGVIEEDMVQRMENELRSVTEHEENETHAERQNQQQKIKNPKSKKGKQSKQQTTSAQDSEVYDNRKADDFEERLEYTTLLLRRDLCRGVVHNIAVLSQAKLLTNPPTSITMFTTHKRRFEKRYEAFRTIPHPPPLTYEDYVWGTDFSTVASDDLVASATNCFRSAKGAIDWLLGAIVLEGGDKPATALLEKRHDDDLFIPIRRQELLHLAKVCVHNLLFFHKLTSMGGVPQPSEKNTSVRLEFNAHKQYCTLSIV